MDDPLRIQLLQSATLFSCSVYLGYQTTCQVGLGESFGLVTKSRNFGFGDLPGERPADDNRGLDSRRTAASGAISEGGGRAVCEVGIEHRPDAEEVACTATRGGSV
jgi:hypothetical protein